MYCFIRSPHVFRSLKAFYAAPPTGWMKLSRGWVLPAASQQWKTSRVTPTTCRSERQIKAIGDKKRIVVSTSVTIHLLASWHCEYLLIASLILMITCFYFGLQLVLDDSERIRNALHDFVPVLDEITAVCDMSSQQEKLQHNDKQVHKMQRKILEPLQHLLEAIGVRQRTFAFQIMCNSIFFSFNYISVIWNEDFILYPQTGWFYTSHCNDFQCFISHLAIHLFYLLYKVVESIEMELITIEKNVPKIRAILSSVENSDIPLREHLHNRQVKQDCIFFLDRKGFR